MKYFNPWTIIFLVVGLCIYGVSPGFVELIHNYSLYSLRKQLIYLTGILAFCMMSLAVILAARFGLVNKLAHGLDKVYWIHKSAGIFCLFFILIHWLLKKAPHWLEGIYIIARPTKGVSKVALSDTEIYLIKLGNTIVDYTFYIVVILIIIALIYKVSYSLFRVTHKLFPLVYLLVAYHAATIQLKGDLFKTPSGYLLSVLVVLGTVSACIALLQLIGYRHKTTAKIEALDCLSNGVIVLKLTLSNPVNYQAGQFVFLKFAHSAEPHPFSIVSFDGSQNTMCFVIKALGDFTQHLNASVAVGQTVVVEGPYGALTFNDHAQRQIYIAGGIGITPFVTRLTHLIKCHESRHIELWFCAKGELSAQFPHGLDGWCRQARVKLHYVNSLQKNDLLTQLDQAIDMNERNISIWFCGPVSLRKAIERLIKDKNLDVKCLHYDNFRIR